jgi:PiT family inorganic phosphate transporter
VGLIMLILIGILPAHYAVNGNLNLAQISGTVAQVQQMDVLVGRFGMSEDAATIQQELRQIGATLSNKHRLTDLSAQERTALRSSILDVDEKLGEFEVTQGLALSVQDRAILKIGRARLRNVIDFVVTWVVIAVALALGIGTTVGWKRIVVTVGEKIGRTHLTYAQGASAELVAMSTIAGADLLGLPVSTTHVLSSGVAGTMAANQSGLQLKTIRAIAMAWVLTLPVTMLLSGTLFSITARSSMKEISKLASVRSHQERVLRKLE